MPRNKEEYNERRQQIINGALEVFARKGFAQATIKDIAQAAGIRSPGLIYHYFKDKQALLRQIFASQAPLAALNQHPEHLYALPVREGLLLIAHTFLRVLEKRAFFDRFKLFLGEVIRHPDLFEAVVAVGPVPVFALLSTYLEHQMAAGALRRSDPAIAVRCFVGPLVAYVLTRELLKMPDAAAIAPADMATQAVDVFLRGLQSEQA
jgi:TetR/AcrR family transcriptional regulator, mexJK operon transcriptional repressor